MVQAAPTPAQIRALHEVTAPAQPPAWPRALPKVSPRPGEGKVQGGHGAETPPGLPAPSALEELHLLRIARSLRPRSPPRPCPDSGSRGGPPREGFRPRGQAWGLGRVMKPRAAHPYPDPDSPPSLGALPAAAGPGKRVWALDSHRHSAAASPGSSPEALRAQGAKQEAGTNGRTGGPG